MGRAAALPGRGAPLLGLVLAALLLAWPAASRADLAGDAARIRTGWSRLGLDVGHLGTVFLHLGQHQDLAWPQPRDSGQACQSLVVIGERHLSFDLQPLRLEGPAAGPRTMPEVDESEPRRASRAGIAAFVACGAERRQIGGVRVRMLSSRGALELLLVRHGGPLPSLEQVAPERSVGPVAAGGELGRPVRSRPLRRRAQDVVQAARRSGAELAVRLETKANHLGIGALGLELQAGCHRVVVLADESTGEADGERDLDAEARRPGAPEALQQDRSHAPDARLEFCLGAPESVQVRFIGAGGPVAVMVVVARWPLPTAATLTSDTEARAALAWALFRRPSPDVFEPPLLVARGGPGATKLPVDLEPGACYLAAMAQVRGEAGAARLSASSTSRTVRDESRQSPPGGAVTFCVGPERHALITVELRSGFGWWVLGLWRMTAGGGR